MNNSTEDELEPSPQRCEDRSPPFPIVGVGASAGGLEAFTQMLEHIPADTGMSFVFVQHLAPHHVSLLASILAQSTVMPVMEVREKTALQPDHIYVIPPNTLMRIANSQLELTLRPEERGAPRPIDCFFRSLAQDCKGLGIGVLLSGSDSDGALGLQSIREEGGIAIAQTEGSAKNPEMPRAAIAAGTVDLVLSPEDIGRELGRIARHPALASGEWDAVPEFDMSASAVADREKPLNRLFELLRGITDIDFSGYKPGTLRRRIARRMLLQHHENLESYISSIEADCAESDPAELAALSEDVLIHVTGFFRDTEAFELFQKLILPRLLKARAAVKSDDNMPFRVWVPGCSSGQEVYSIAMCLVEAMEKSGSSFPVQIFGTDLSEQAIAKARKAIYAESEVAKLSHRRQARFFVRSEQGLQILKPVREMCVFARQNLLADPPFTRLNLISCRNPLIYLEPAMQRHAIAAFHYALQPEGCLWLGHSESLRDFPEWFSRIDKRYKFFSRAQTRDPLILQVLRQGMTADRVRPAPLPAPSGERAKDGARETTDERGNLSEFAPDEFVLPASVLDKAGPPWVLANVDFEITNSSGDISRYLQIVPGRATLNLLRMARDDIRSELTRLLNMARSREASGRSTVICQEINGVVSETQLEVRRFMEGAAGQDASFLVIFFTTEPASGESQSASTPVDQVAAKSDRDETERLRQELARANRRLNAILAERDVTAQELISANEEIQSGNEELQSINEELETAKEELQSSNEELNTLNEELHHRNQELVRLSDDLANLLSSTAIPILMLDNDLRIRRVTPVAERLFNIRKTDVGRPIGDIRLQLSEEDLDALVRRVIDTLIGEEIELLDRESRWHVLRVRPYRTADNRIEGAVLAMIDIDQLRRARNTANTAREFAESLIESVQTPLLVLQRDLRIRIANRAFLAAWDLRLSDVEHRPLLSLGIGDSGDAAPHQNERHNDWNSPELVLALGRLSRGETISEDLECMQNIRGSGQRTLLINARQVRHGGAGPEDDFQILFAANDITAQRRAEEIMLEEQDRLKRSVQSTARELEQTESALHGSEDALRGSREELRALTGSLLNAQDEERRRVSRELHDDVSQNMAKLQFDIETLEQSLPSDREREKKRLLLIRDAVGQLSNDLRKIAYGLHPSTLDHLGLAVALRAYGREFAKRTGIRVKFTASEAPAQVPPEIASSFYRITQEALRNVGKHGNGCSAAIRLTGGPTHLTLVMSDDGPGFKPESVRGNGGLGLISMEERARLIHASFKLETQPGKGTTISVSAPLV